MRKSLFIGILFLLAAPCWAQSLDSYYGDSTHVCVGVYGLNTAGHTPGTVIPGATGYFYLYKDTNLRRWMFCDPLGNRYFYQAVQVIDGNYAGSPNNVNTATKYGNNTGYEYWIAQNRRLQALGFNAVGEYGDLRAFPACTIYGAGNTQQIPFVFLVNALSSTLAKGLFSNLPPAYTAYRGGGFKDIFDPNFTTNVNTQFSAAQDGARFCNGGTPSGLDTNPWLIGVVTDDSDFLYALPGVYTDSHLGLLSAEASSYQPTINGVVWADTQFYLKTNLRTFLTTRYGTVGALNTAWGSTYSTLGTTSTTAGSETIGTGNGVLTSFSHTFAHGTVDPASILISVGGVAQGGDCPWFKGDSLGNCNSAGSGHANIQAATGNINGGTVTYASGGATCGGQASPCITVTFSAAPANAVAITATYQYGGWPKATAGGTGFLDEDGSSAWMPATIANPPVGTVATDLNDYLTQIATQYYSTIYTRMRAALPHHLILGPDVSSIGSRPGVAAQISAYTDAEEYTHTEAIGIGPGVGAAATTASYNSKGLPVIAYTAVTTSGDSQFTWTNCAATGWDCGVDQVDRGRVYLGLVRQWYGGSYIGADGYSYIVGTDWFQWVDRNSETQNFGIVTLDDNLYGYYPGNSTLKESINRSITDGLGNTTTPDNANYGNFVQNGLVCGLQVWLGTACAGISGTPAAHLP